MLFDKPLDELQTYTGSSGEPADFDQFWSQTLAEARQAAWPAQLSDEPNPFAHTVICDVRFSGWQGEPINAWLRYPADADGPLPAIIIYQGYGGGRGFPFDNLGLVEAGYAVLNVDTRGQGASWGYGDTPDSGPASASVPGWMTRGILDPATYYYRRLMTDCVMAVDAVAALDLVDSSRIGVTGGSQGGGLSLAVAGLSPQVAACAPRVPFLCDYRRATEITDGYPYREITDYIVTHRRDEEQVYRTLSYFDSVNFAKRALAPLDVSLGLMDTIVPPSTVFAMYNNYRGQDKQITVWSHNGHEGGGVEDDVRSYHFFARLLGGRDY